MRRRWLTRSISWERACALQFLRREPETGENDMRSRAHGTLSCGLLMALLGLPTLAAGGKAVPAVHGTAHQAAPAAPPDRSPATLPLFAAHPRNPAARVLSTGEVIRTPWRAWKIDWTAIYGTADLKAMTALTKG